MQAEDGGAHAPDEDQSGLTPKSWLESLLFVADEPVSISRLATALELSRAQVEAALSGLIEDYTLRGLRLQRRGERVQMVTAPECADHVRAFLGLERGTRLTPAALETLSIIAYQQPVTRAQIEAVRGVSSDSVLRTLINRGLIEETGRLEQAGRPIIYGTTFEFLQEFGLASLGQLPPLVDPDADQAPGEEAESL